MVLLLVMALKALQRVELQGVSPMEQPRVLPPTAAVSSAAQDAWV